MRGAEPGAVVSAGTSWALGAGRLRRELGARHASVTAVNASLLIPGFSRRIMVHASPPSPPPPMLSFGEWAYTSQFLNARVKRFQLVAMIFLPNWCHLSIQSFSPLLPPLSTHFNTLVRENSGAFVQFFEMRLWCFIPPTWLRERLGLAGGSNIRGQQVPLVERRCCLWDWLQLCPCGCAVSGRLCEDPEGKVAAR